MSDPMTKQRDRGFSLIEVMMTTAVIGMVMAVVSTALVLTIRQQENTAGRLNVARGEQNLGTWLPADLASGEEVSIDPAVSPCGTNCPSGTTVRGSNAIMLTWTSLGAGATSSVETTTKVSYRYAQVDGGYILERVECKTFDGGPPSCQQHIVVSDMDAPPLGTNFVAGETAPSWAFEVTAPLPPDDDGSGVPTQQTEVNAKNAQRVMVTINGGGLSVGAGGGRNQIVLGAGGTQRLEIDGASVLGTPTFTQARSRCGGDIVIIVDESGSIGSAITNVRDAVADFVETFTGTPVRLKVVRFSTRATVLGTTGWSRWFNMLNDTDVSQLTTATAGLVSNGGTNWEDGLHRTFYNSDGTVQSVIPDLVVFFTDGVPTYSRVDFTNAAGPTNPPARLDGYPAATGNTYNQEAWFRANHIAQTFRGSVRFIGVGVGSGITSSSTWLTGSPATMNYERGNNVVWERNQNFLWERGNNVRWQRGNALAFERGFRWSGSSKLYSAPFTNWESTTRSTYESNNTVAGESDGWRTRATGTSTSWSNTTQVLYERSNTNNTSTDGWRTLQTSTSTSWSSVTQADFETYNVTADSSDGWRTRLSSLSNTWSTSTQADYERYNTDATSNDGWRTRQTSASTSWTAVTAAEFNAYNTTDDQSDGWRSFETSYLIPSSVSNGTVLRRLISGNDHGVAAILQNGQYTNATQADNYVLPNWDQLDDALRAVALAECGGTLTVQTRVGSAAAGDPFTYQNTGITNSAGNAIESELRVVTTTPVFPSGTFDFDIGSGTYVDVTLEPTNTSGLLAYVPGTWSCRAGSNPRAVTTFPVGNAGWRGLTVRVAANEAVSCIHSVTRT